MSVLNILLLYLLIVNSNANSIDSVFKNNRKDMEKCERVSRSQEATLERCIEITPSFSGPKKSESKCCMVTSKIDPLERLKLELGEDWKKEFMRRQKLNEQEAEEKLKLIYDYAPETSVCYDLIENYENVELYGLSIPVFDGQLKYDCGDGEKTFDREKYNPSDEEEKMYKDHLDCSNQFEENFCLKKGSELISDNYQCCWCEEIFVYNEKENRETRTSNCEGYPIKELKNKLEEFVDEKKDKKITKKCICSDKNGNHLKLNLNTFNGNFEITN
jgi:hypothetical protein